MKTGFVVFLRVLRTRYLYLPKKQLLIKIESLPTIYLGLGLEMESTVVLTISNLKSHSPICVEYRK